MKLFFTRVSSGLFGKARLRLYVWLSLVTQILIVVTGGLVRLTGSGLGCPTWPKCTDESLVSTSEMGIHGIIEFGNRLLAFVLLIIALLTFIVVVRASEALRVILPRLIAFFAGVFVFIAGLILNNVQGLTPLTLFVLGLSALMMLGFAVVILAIAKSRDPKGLIAPAFLLGAGIILQAVIGGVTVLTGLNSWIVGLHFMVSMALIATASLLVWRALPKPAGPVSAVNSLLAWPTFLVGIVAISFGVVVTGAGPHAGDAATPRNGLDLEVWQHFHSYPGYLMLLLISVQLVSQLQLTGASARPLENRVLLLLFATASAQAVIGVVQSRLGVPELLVGVHMLGAACLASLLSFQLFSGRSFTR